jgi:hypothetical protein
MAVSLEDQFNELRIENEKTITQLRAEYFSHMTDMNNKVSSAELKLKDVQIETEKRAKVLYNAALALVSLASAVAAIISFLNH